MERKQTQVDVHNRDWDLASRITTAQGALARGVTADVRNTYDDTFFGAATAAGNQHGFARATS